MVAWPTERKNAFLADDWLSRSQAAIEATSRQIGETLKPLTDTIPSLDALRPWATASRQPATGTPSVEPAASPAPEAPSSAAGFPSLASLRLWASPEEQQPSTGAVASPPTTAAPAPARLMAAIGQPAAMPEQASRTVQAAPGGSWGARARAAAVQAGHPDPDEFVEQMRLESMGFRPDVISGERPSSAGALGIAQIMPDVARQAGVDPLDPDAALTYAARRMAQNHRTYGDPERALAEYNMGAGNLERYGPRGLEDTAAYIDRIRGNAAPRPQPTTPTAAEQTPAAQAQGAVALAERPTQFAEGLSYAEAIAACGLAGVAWFVAKTGRTPATVAEVRDAASVSQSWDPGSGMHGAQATAGLLRQYGIAAHVEDGVDWDKVRRDVASGNPVMFDTDAGSAGHYYTVQATRQRSDGRWEYDLGTSATDLRASQGRRWFTADEVEGLGFGRPHRTIYTDNPQTPQPSPAAGRSAPTAGPIPADVSPAGGGLPPPAAGAGPLADSAPSMSPDTGAVQPAYQASAGRSGGGIMARQPLQATPGPDSVPDVPPYDPDQGPREATPGSVGASPLPATPTADDEPPAILPTPRPEYLPAYDAAPPKPAEQYAGPIETRQPAAEQPAPESPLKPVWDAAGRVIGYVQAGAEAIGNTIASEGIATPIGRGIGNQIRAATGREPLPDTGQPETAIDRAIVETARSLPANVEAARSGYEQGSYGQAALGALGAVGDLAPSMLLARQLNEMLPRVETPLGEVGAGDVVITASVAHALGQLGYGAAKIGGRIPGWLARLAQDGVPAEQATRAVTGEVIPPPQRPAPPPLAVAGQIIDAVPEASATASARRALPTPSSAEAAPANIEGRVQAAQARLDDVAGRLAEADASVRRAERAGVAADVATADRAYTAVRREYDAAADALATVQDERRGVGARIEEAGYGRPLEDAGVTTTAVQREATAPYEGRPAGPIPRTVDEVPRTPGLNAGLPFDPASAAAGAAAGAPTGEGEEPDPWRTGAGMLVAGVAGRRFPNAAKWYRDRAARNAAQMAARGITPLSWLEHIRGTVSDIGYSSMMGPSTFSVGLFSGAVEPLYATPKEIARGVGRAISERNLSALREPGEMAGGAVTGLGYIGEALWDVLRAKGRYAGHPDRPPMSERVADPMGRLAHQLLETPGRLWAGVPDAIFGTVAQHAGEAREAAQIATERQGQGLFRGPGKWADYVATLLDEAHRVRTTGSPHVGADTQRVIDAGLAYAKRATFQQDVGTIGRQVEKVAKLGNAPVLGNLSAPFFKTPWNLELRQGERSILGAIPDIPALSFKNTQKGFDRYYDAIVGSALVLGMGAYAKNGGITGSGPADKGQRDLLVEKGWQPYSLLVAGIYVPNRAFGYAENLLNAVGEAHDWSAYQKRGDPSRSLGWDALRRVGNLARQAPFAAGYAAIADLLGQGPVAAAGDIATRLTPGSATMRGIATATDERQRTIERGPTVGVLDELGQRWSQGTGIGRQVLPAAQGTFGEPKENQQKGIWAFFPKTSKAHEDAVVQQFLNTNVSIPQPRDHILIANQVPERQRAPGEGATFQAPLTKAEQRTWNELRGRDLRNRIEILLRNPGWERQAPGNQQQTLQANVELAAQQADILMQNRLGPKVVQERIRQGLADQARKKAS